MSFTACPTRHDQLPGGVDQVQSAGKDELLSADDGLLVERVARQDRLAFEVLYRRHYHRLLHFVSRKVRSDALAEEVVSDTLFVLWRNAGSFQGASSVMTWLFGIAHRQALRTLERNHKHSIVDSNADVVAAAADVGPGTNPEAVAITDSDGKLLAKGVATLSEQHRIVVELTATGHSSGEIAAIVGCLENTVRTRMFHARQHLRRFLARDAGDSEGGVENGKEREEVKGVRHGGRWTVRASHRVAAKARPQVAELPIPAVPLKASSGSREGCRNLSEWLERVCELAVAAEES